MLLWFVIGYWLISIGIGLWAALRVHNSKDFAIAGRKLPFYMVTATVFATWFGAEILLGIPSTFLKGGLGATIADPFGSSLCLILVGLFFAAPLYRMKLLTIGDFYRKRFGRVVEVLTTLAIVLSYLGWVGAQIQALGLVFNIVSDNQISIPTGMWIGSITILIYTFFGGMWAVAVTDFIQMIVIVLGMLYIGHEISGQVGGVSTVIEHAQNTGKLTFWPAFDWKAILAFGAAWITMMFGSIPQQDVFQRVQSSRTEKIAVWASILGGILYFCFAFVPMFLVVAATLIDPNMVQHFLSSTNEKDAQRILPALVLTHAPMFAQVMFFGALLSAIKSCASATLLAPSVTFTENILKPFLGNKLTDRKLLLSMRIVTLVFTVLVTLYALSSSSTIYQMVENAYQVTLVVAFIPLVFGLFWKRATTQGALAAIILGTITWLLFMNIEALEDIPAQFAGLVVSLCSMVVGSLLPQVISTPAHNHDTDEDTHTAQGHYHPQQHVYGQETSAAHHAGTSQLAGAVKNKPPVKKS